MILKVSSFNGIDPRDKCEIVFNPKFLSFTNVFLNSWPAKEMTSSGTHWIQLTKKIPLGVFYKLIFPPKQWHSKRKFIKI